MNSKTKIVVAEANQSSGSLFLDAFADIGPLDGFDIKKDQIAANMVGLMAHYHVSRSDLANTLGLPRSRVSQMLSGERNLTLKTIYEFTTALKKDFSIVFHDVGVTCFSQPWHSSANSYLTPDVTTLAPSNTCLWAVQTASQIARDAEAGIGKSIQNIAKSLTTSEEISPSPPSASAE